MWAAFLAGWMDTDGCVPKTVNKAFWCSISPGLLADGQEMLARLGINSIVWRNLLNVSGREQLSALYEILKPFMSNVEKSRKFEIKSRIEGTSRYHANCADRITSVEILPPESTISIEVAKTNTHITNGIITHNSKHGISPSAVIIDEIHAHPNGELYEVLTSGTDYARRQQVVLIITTAGIYDKNSIWWKLRTRAQQVKAGIIDDPRFLPVLYLADPEKDDPADEELWKRVNPSLGQIFTLDKIRQDYNEAKNNPVDFQNFLRFRLNIPVKQLSRWMPMDKWDACDAQPPAKSLLGRSCYGGLDLSSKLDLSAFVLVFPPEEPDGIFEVLWKFYCPEEGILKRSRVDRVPYDIWQKQGFLTATPGNVIDYAFIQKDIFEAAELYKLEQLGFDSWNATETANRIMEKLNPTNYENGFQCVEVRQGPKSFNEPAKSLLVHIMTGKIRHGGNPVARWNADNLVMRSDANGNVAPDKEHATEKIDGMVALIMAWGRAMFKVDTTSVYEERGVHVF
jgi:phage terminase large subunit-like protein